MRENEVLNDSETSPWLREALCAALKCDPVRVANDVEMLRTLLHKRAAESVMPAVETEVRFPAEWVPAA